MMKVTDKLYIYVGEVKGIELGESGLSIYGMASLAIWVRYKDISDEFKTWLGREHIHIDKLQGWS